MKAQMMLFPEEKESHKLCTYCIQSIHGTQLPPRHFPTQKNPLLGYLLPFVRVRIDMPANKFHKCRNWQRFGTCNAFFLSLFVSGNDRR